MSDFTHVFIERDLAFDDQQRVHINVYARNPVRSLSGGYLAYALDGTLVETCATEACP